LTAAPEETEKIRKKEEKRKGKEGIYSNGSRGVTNASVLT